MKRIYTNQQMKQFSVFALVTLLFVLISPILSYSYNWPWDQGHDACVSLDGEEGWGLVDYDGKQQGNYSTKECCELLCKACPVYANTGQLQKTFTDLTVPGIGPSLSITRTYNSQDWATAMLGNGWTFNFGRKLIISRTKDGEKRIGVLRGTGEKNFFRENLDGTIERITEYGVPYSLFKNSDNTYTILNNDGTSYELRQDGKISQIVDRNMNTLIFSYNSVGCISRITNASGNYVDFILGPNGKIASVSDNLGRTISYSYDENGNLVSVADPMNNTVQYVYNSDNLLTQFIDARGNVIETVTYDNHQPPRVSIFTEKGETFTMVYANGSTQKSDSQGNQWTYYYNDLGIIERIVDPLGNEKRQLHNKVTSTSLDWDEDLNGNRTTYTYDAGGNVASMTDPLGNTTAYTYISGTDVVETVTTSLGVVTRYEYDTNGNLLSHIRDFGGPLENTINYTYDTQELQTSMTDLLANTTLYEYDAAGNLIRLTDALGNARTFTYDDRGNKVTDTDPNGNTHIYSSYDLLDRMVSSTDAQGHITTYIYDANGNQVKVQLPNGEEISFEYGIYNRLIKSTDPQGNLQTYVYEDQRLISQTDANGNLTHYSYDALGRAISMTNAEGHQTTYGYDAAGNVLTVTDAQRNTTTFTYDALNRQSQRIYPDGTNYTYAYDALSRKTSQTDPNGNTITYAYDRMNRMVQKQYPDGTTTDFTYDSLGRILYGNNLDSTLGYTYDALGRVVSSTQNGKTIQYGYDAAGNIVSLTTPEGEIVQYSYNSASFMTQMQLSGGKGIGFTYDSLGRVIRKDYSGGMNAIWSFDQAGRLASLDYRKNDGTPIYTQVNTFEGAGNILQKTTGEGSTSYSYDKIQQIITADYPAMNDEHFTYDLVGNRLTSADHTNWIYNNRNELESYNGVNYTYDQNGNITSKSDAAGTTIFYHNYENRMVRVNLPSGGYATYKYDARGRRTEKNVDGTVTSYLFSGDALLAEYDAFGSLQRNYFNGKGDINPSMLTEGGQIYFYVKDHIDTPQKVVNESGDVGWAASYKSFGEADLAVSSVECNFRFPGQYLDQESGLYYNYFRYYDPQIGRYLQNDPVVLLDGANDYAYAISNPISYIDPYGLVEIVGGSGSNCLGGAISGKNDVYRYPDSTKDTKTSFIDAMGKKGWSCYSVSNQNNCKCDCEESKLLVTLYRNEHSNNYGKDPWTDPSYKFGFSYENIQVPFKVFGFTLFNYNKKKRIITDIHAIRGDSGCRQKYSQIPHYEPNPQSRDSDIDWKLFTGTPLVCCCMN